MHALVALAAALVVCAASTACSQGGPAAAAPSTAAPPGGEHARIEDDRYVVSPDGTTLTVLVRTGLAGGPAQTRAELTAAETSGRVVVRAWLVPLPVPPLPVPPLPVPPLPVPPLPVPPLPVPPLPHPGPPDPGPPDPGPPDPGPPDPGPQPRARSACTAMHALSPVGVRLAAPLGDRPVVDRFARVLVRSFG